MLETMAATTTFVKCGTISGNSGQNNSSPTDPLLWDCQQFPDSNTKFSPIKQEIMDTYDTIMPQSDFTELKPMPFDYGSPLTGIDPVLSNNNNNNNSSNNNNNHTERKVMDQHLNIYIKPLSPPTPSNRESFSSCFNQSPSDVTSSGSISPPGIVKIDNVDYPKIDNVDYPTGQDEFDDIANIVGISMGADSTVPTLENDIDLDAWIENTASNIKQDNGNVYESILPTSSDSNSITNISMTSTQPYLANLPGTTLANLLNQANKGPRVTSLEHRETFPTILSPILRSQLTGYQGAAYPIIKQETYDTVMKQEYYSNEQMPHSTVGSMADHRRLGLDSLGRNKPKPPKPRPRLLGNGGGGGCQGDQGKKMMHHCQICNRGFLNKSNIKVHLRTHTGEKPFGCEHCSKAFRQKAHLLKHMSIHKRISRD